MENPLDAIAVRILGSLMEKQVTTPDNYPLTINALVNACNQTSSRDPILAVDEASVSDGLKDLAGRGLVREVYRSDSRAKRYRHLMEESLSLHPAELAVMCVLMLRGAQTAGEIRSRTSRLFEFGDLAHVDVTLQALMTLATPLVAEAPRQPGQKETRYVHLLSGEPPPVSESQDVKAETDTSRPADLSRLEALEQTVESLQSEMSELRTRFEEFRQQFQ
jgi:uncharacterized protein